MVFELLDLLIHDVLRFGDELEQQTEQPDKVEQTADSDQGNMVFFAHEVNQMRDHQLGHNLNDHISSHLLTSVFLGEEREGLLKEVDHPLLGVHGLNLGNVLLLLFIVGLSLFLVRLVITEVHGQPVGELVAVNRFAYTLLLESTEAKQIE